MKEGDLIECIRDLQMFTYNTIGELIPTKIACYKGRYYYAVNEFSIINEDGIRHNILYGTDFFTNHFKITK